MAVFLFGHLTITTSAAYDCNITAFTSQVEEENLNYTCKTAYVSGIDNADAQSKINTALEETVKLRQQKARVKAEKDGQFNGQLDFEVTRNSGSMTSIRYRETMQQGDISYECGITFDCTTGKIYKLGELFREDSGWQRYITNEVIKLATEKEMTGEQDNIEISVIQDYCISDEMLTLIFNEEQIAECFGETDQKVVKFEIPLINLKYSFKPEIAELIFMK